MKFLYKILIASLIIYFCQLVISEIYSPRIPDAARIFNNLASTKKPEIIYFGDSTNYITDSLDKNTDSVVLFLEKSLHVPVGVLGRAGGHPGVYSAYAAYVSRLKQLPKHVIVCINMRVFSNTWDREPTWGFEEEKRYFRVFADSPWMPFWRFFSDNAFFNLEALPANNFENVPLLYTFQTFGFLKDTRFRFSNVSVGDDITSTIVDNYMYNLQSDHRKILSLLEIADILTSKGVKVVYYFTPINYEPKEAYVGKKFTEKLKTNVSIVKKALTEKSVTIVDLSMSLPSEAFTWRENLYKNEHMAEQGRRFVAESLAKTILETNKNGK